MQSNSDGHERVRASNDRRAKRVAAWITHGADDTVEPIALGTQVRS
jgi:hypothetical protein